MTRDPHSPSDAELVARLRRGDLTAFDLIDSRHRHALRSLSRVLDPVGYEGDLATEALHIARTTLARGKGPAVSLRPWLLMIIRRVCEVRASCEVPPYFGEATDFVERPFADSRLSTDRHRLVIAAFATMPEAWQACLWHSDVEQDSEATIADLLAIREDFVAGLVVRARLELRVAVRHLHAQLAGDQCGAMLAQSRGGTGSASQAKLRKHLRTCPTCSAAQADLAAITSSVAPIVGPHLLGPWAADYPPLARYASQWNLEKPTG